MKIDILAIAAHPDDVELSCGGTLMMEKSFGKSVGVIDLTKGELGTRGNPELRALESQKAAEIMGLDCRLNLGLPDGFFANNEQSQRALITLIRKLRPEIVLASALQDRHPDHGKAGELIRTSCFLSGLKKIETFDLEGITQDSWRPKYVLHCIQDRYYDPSFVYDITPVFERKLEAIQAFSSQFHHPVYQTNEPQTYISSPDYLNSIIGRHQMFGKMIGVQYAEGFISEKMLGLRTLESLVQRDT